MQESSDPHAPLVAAVRGGDSAAWQRLIDAFEGRLLAFANSRLRDRALSEDIVQETFVGFLTSLPNYDDRRPLESYLFSICAYKLTDHLRKTGRRPPIVASRRGDDHDDGLMQFAGSGRVASSIARSGERQRIEEKVIASAVSEMIERWTGGGEWQKLKAIELLIVAGLANKDVAVSTGLSEQQVANLKSDFHLRLKAVVQRAGLDRDVFPELYA